MKDRLDDKKEDVTPARLEAALSHEGAVSLKDLLFGKTGIFSSQQEMIKNISEIEDGNYTTEKRIRNLAIFLNQILNNQRPCPEKLRKEILLVARKRLEEKNENATEALDRLSRLLLRAGKSANSTDMLIDDDKISFLFGQQTLKVPYSKKRTSSSIDEIAAMLFLPIGDGVGPLFNNLEELAQKMDLYLTFIKDIDPISALQQFFVNYNAFDWSFGLHMQKAIDSALDLRIPSSVGLLSDNYRKKKELSDRLSNLLESAQVESEYHLKMILDRLQSARCFVLTISDTLEHRRYPKLEYFYNIMFNKLKRQDVKCYFLLDKGNPKACLRQWKNLYDYAKHNITAFGGTGVERNQPREIDEILQRYEEQGKILVAGLDTISCCLPQIAFDPESNDACDVYYWDWDYLDDVKKKNIICKASPAVASEWKENVFPQLSGVIEGNRVKYQTFVEHRL